MRFSGLIAGIILFASTISMAQAQDLNMTCSTTLSNAVTGTKLCESKDVKLRLANIGFESGFPMLLCETDSYSLLFRSNNIKAAHTIYFDLEKNMVADGEAATPPSTVSASGTDTDYPSGGFSGTIKVSTGETFGVIVNCTF